MIPEKEENCPHCDKDLDQGEYDGQFCRKCDTHVMGFGKKEIEMAEKEEIKKYKEGDIITYELTTANAVNLNRISTSHYVDFTLCKKNILKHEKKPFDLRKDCITGMAFRWDNQTVYFVMYSPTTGDPLFSTNKQSQPVALKFNTPVRSPDKDFCDTDWED